MKVKPQWKQLSLTDSNKARCVQMPEGVHGPPYPLWILIIRLSHGLACEMCQPVLHGWFDIK